MTNRISRRGLLAGAAAGVAASRQALAQPAIAAKAPIRIGAVLPITGLFQVITVPMLAGLNVAVEQINASGGIDGRMIDLVLRDDGTDPARSSAALRELAGLGINLVVGPFPTANVLAGLPVLVDTKTVSLSVGAQVLAITHELYTPYHFRMVDNTWMRYFGYGRAMAQRYPDILNWTAMSSDTATTLQSWDFFSRGLQVGHKAAGRSVQITPPQMVSNTAMDYRNQIPALVGGEATGLYLCMSGQQHISFLNQARPFGLAAHFKAIAENGNEFPVANALKSNIPQNYWSTTDWYCRGYLDTPMGKALYDGMVAKTGNDMPPGFAQPAFDALQALVWAIRKSGSTESDAVIKALGGATLASARGPCTFRAEDHQAIVDIQIMGFAPTTTARGWEVTEFIHYPGADAVEPASPGTPFKV